MTLGSLKIRLKPISWELKTDSLGHPIQIAILPFGFEAKIFKGVDNFYWQICNDVPLGLGKFQSESDFAQTEQEAKNACQKAWEEILMEAFEEDYS